MTRYRLPVLALVLVLLLVVSQVGGALVWRPGLALAVFAVGCALGLALWPRLYWIGYRWYAAPLVALVVLAGGLGSAHAQSAFASVGGRVTVQGAAMPLPDFLQALGRQSGRSVLLAPGVPATVVNYQFSGLSWPVAWEAVTAANTLESCMTDEVLAVGPRDAVAPVCARLGVPLVVAAPAVVVPVVAAPLARYAVRVRLLEIADNASSGGGVDWSKGLLPGVLTGVASVLTGGTFSPAALTTSISALEEKGLARKLDDVRLLLTSGQRTSFASGGTLQLSLVGAGAANIERQLQYGLTLGLTPTPQPDGSVALDVSADLASPVSVSNPQLLDLTRRSVAASVAVRPGSGVVLSAFTSTRDESSAAGLPGAASLPVVGWLAGRASSSSARSTVVVTLELEQ